MRRHLPQPLDAGRLHGRIGVQALGDGVGDDGLALFLQKFHQPPLLGHQFVNLGRFAVEEGGDLGCFVFRRTWKKYVSKSFSVQNSQNISS